jgi:CSLREA domain-containing protein
MMKLLILSLALPLAVVAAQTPALAEAPLAFAVNSTADLPDVNPGDGICLTSEGHCTLRAALDEVTKSGAAASIRLPAGTFTLTAGPLVVATDVTMTGSGRQTVLNAGTGEGVLRVAGSSLRLGELAVQGGTSAVGGGSAISAEEAALELHAVQVTGAHSDQGGGALQVAGGSVVLDNTTVRDSDGRDGGALSAINASVTIVGSTFQRNTATAHGGALFVSYPSALSIKGSTFDSNVAIGQGGAVYLEGRSREAKDATVSATFTSNSARDAGGAMFIRTTSNGLTDGKVLIGGSTFKNNDANVGGALGVNDGVVSVTGTTFTANSARHSGGAIGAAGELTIDGSTFTSNTTPGSGGAITSLGLLKISGSTFTTNSAGEAGGALAMQGYAMPSISSSLFRGNTAGNGASAIWRGGAGLQQSRNTMEADQTVVVDQPARPVQKVSLTTSAKDSRPWQWVAVAAGLLFLLVLLNAGLVLGRRRRRS